MSIQEKIRELLAIQEVERKFKVQMEGMLEQHRKQCPDDDESVRQKLKKKLYELDLLGRLVPIWEEHYSEEEIQAQIDFYRSQIGQKILKTQEEMMLRQNQIIMGVMEELVQFVVGELLVDKLKSELDDDEEEEDGNS